MELRHFDKHSPAKRERKALQGKNFLLFRLETLTNFILNEKLFPQMTTIRAFFFSKLGHYFPVIKKGRGDLPPPPCSYAPALLPTTFRRS